MTDSLADAPVDLDNCAREQIQFLGHVQPYGCLLAVTEDWVIEHASANTGDMLGHAAETLIGTELAGLFARDVMHDIRGRLQMLGHGTGAARIYGIDLLGDGQLFDMSVHLSGAHYLFEFEPKDETGTRDEMSLVQPLIARVRRRPEIAAMARDAARAMKALTGFDRVMIYQFQRDDSGRVIAEAAAPGLSPFSGCAFRRATSPRRPARSTSATRSG